MKTPNSREDLFKFYTDCDESTWNEYINSLSVPSHAVTETLYHMSFTMVPEGVWSPRVPVMGEASSEAHPIYGEMLPSRISTSTSIEGCWAGIFCYLVKDKSLGKEITAYLYEAKPQRGCRLITADTLSNKYLVQDAHLTDEYCLLGDVKMTLVNKLVLRNTLSVSESKWIKGNPFKEVRYGDVHYPPLVILSNEPIKTETNMSTLKLNFSKDVLQNQLSLEAATNPLGLLAEGMTTKFTVLLTQLNTSTAMFSNIINTGTVFTLAPRKIRAITTANNYMQLINYGVGVPPGFIGPLVPYMNLLIEHLNLYKNIRRDIIAPVSAELGAMLGNPDKLRSSSVSPLSKIDFYEKPNKGFTDRVATFYNPASTRDELAYSRLFNDNSEFVKAGELAVSLEDILNKVNRELKDVVKDINIISGLTDKLAIRITQDTKTYGINASIANDLATVITNTATAVSILSALIVMGEEAAGIVDNLAKKIN